jgi:hypothetical protein
MIFLARSAVISPEAFIPFAYRNRKTAVVQQWCNPKL